jgi:PAS domain S-box-containing protein
MADGIPFMIWVHGRKGQQEFVNRAYCEFFGVDRDAMVGQTWQDLLHPDDRDTYIDEFLTCERNRRSFHAEARVRRADGQWRWVESFGNPQFYYTGDFLGIVGTSPDITERKMTEQKLRESEERYRIVADNTYDWELWRGPEGHYNYCSPSCFRITGYTPHHFQSEPELIKKIIHPEDISIWRMHCQHQVERKECSGIEFRIHRADGEIRWIGHVCQPVFDTHGNYIGVRASNRDITERKQAEESLRRSEERLRLALDAAFHISFEWNLQRNETYRSSKEPALVATSSDKPGTFEQFLEAVHPDDREPLIEKTKEALKSGEYEHEFRVVRPNGEIAWLYEHGRVERDAQGQPARLIGLSQDITPRKLVEENLCLAKENLERIVAERTSELVSANRSLEKQAHQLRMLAGDLTLTEQRERNRLAGILHDGLQQYLVAAKFHVEEFIDDVSITRFKEAIPGICNLLSESIKVARSLSAELSPPALHEKGILAGLEWLSRWMFEKHRLKVHLATEMDSVSLSEEVKVFVFESIREMLLNVVKHAGTDIVKINLYQTQDNGLRITVTDMGNGFDLARLSCAADSDGGFGLFSIRERMGLLGGSFEAESSPGKGAGFTLTVPLRR